MKLREKTLPMHPSFQINSQRKMIGMLFLSLMAAGCNEPELSPQEKRRAISKEACANIIKVCPGWATMLHAFNADSKQGSLELCVDSFNREGFRSKVDEEELECHTKAQGCIEVVNCRLEGDRRNK